MKKLALISAVFVLGGLLFFTGCQQTAVTSAKVYMQQQNYDKAIEQCKLAVAQMPNDADAYFTLGQAYGEKGMYRDMLDAFNKALSIGPKYSTIIQEYKSKYFAQIFNTGIAQIKQNKYDQAVENYKLCAAIFPQKIEPYINLGYVYTLMKNDSAAIETYKKAIQVDTTNLEVRSSLGVMYYRTKQYENTIATLKPVLEKAKPDTKNYSDAILYMAYSYDLLRQADKAIETYSNALKTNPDNKDLLFNIGRLYIVKGNYQQAAENFKKVVAMDPNDFDANYNTGFCLFQQKKHDESIPYFKKCIEQKPDNTSAWANMVVAMDQSGRKDFEAIYTIGCGLLQLGKFKEAIPYLKKSIEMKADDVSAWEKLAQAYEKAGFAKEAKETQKKAESLKGAK